VDSHGFSISAGLDWTQSVKVEVKDNLEIRGSRVTSQGKPAIIAAEIRKGDQILKLRDENGIPAWSGGGRRQAN